MQTFPFLFFLLGGEKAVWGRSWFGNEMLVRLDIFHWIHRFDAAIRTEPHAKYSAFKSAWTEVSLFKTPGRKVLISKGCYNINTIWDKLKITQGEIWAHAQHCTDQGFEGKARLVDASLPAPATSSICATTSRGFL